MKLLALDPGIRGCGVAFFIDGKLSYCDYVKNPAKTGNRITEIRDMALAIKGWGEYANEIVCEYPQVYTASLSKGDNNDLLALAGVGSALAALHPQVRVTTVLPREWKGQLTKEACEARIRSRLDTAELAILDAMVKRVGAKSHNAVDACGIGLHAVGRFAPKRSWEK